MALNVQSQRAVRKARVQVNAGGNDEFYEADPSHPVISRSRSFTLTDSSSFFCSARAAMWLKPVSSPSNKTAIL